jgi:hypothetical protein
MNNKIREYQIQRIREQDPRVLVMSRPSRLVPSSLPAERKSPFAAFAVMLSRMSLAKNY